MRLFRPLLAFVTWLTFAFCLYGAIPGDWSSASTYSTGDLVIHSGITYQAQQSVSAGVTPGTDTAFWKSLDVLSGSQTDPGSPPSENPDSSEVGNLEDPGTPSSSDVKIVNVSVRGHIGTGDDMRIMAFRLSGSTSVLMRGVGPGLADFGLSGLISNPTMRLYQFNDADDITQGSTEDTDSANDDYTSNANASTIVSANAATFPAITLRSAEAASLPTLSSGYYTVWVWDKNNATGLGYAAIDMTDTSASASFTHVSCRGVVKPGDGAMFGGFEITGTAGNTRKIFLRGRGASLSTWNVSGTMTDPFLRLYKFTDEAKTQSELVTENDNYATSSSSTEIAAYATSLLGAPLDSKDPGILVDLEPGSYTVILESVDNSTGNGWIGIDDVSE